MSCRSRPRSLLRWLACVDLLLCLCCSRVTPRAGGRAAASASASARPTSRRHARREAGLPRRLRPEPQGDRRPRPAHGPRRRPRATATRRSPSSRSTSSACSTPIVERVRKQLPGFTYVLVSSTHNHEGPDTLGLWGPNPFQSGVDPDYLKPRRGPASSQAVRRPTQQAAAGHGPRSAPRQRRSCCTTAASRTSSTTSWSSLQFRRRRRARSRPASSCSGTATPRRSTARTPQVSADYVGYTVEHLHEQARLPGRLPHRHGRRADDLAARRGQGRRTGKPLTDGTFEKTERYGELVGAGGRQGPRRRQAGAR